MTENNNMIIASQVRRICGGVSDMMIWRWTYEGKADFPRPIYIGRRRFWREADIAAWWATRVDEGKPPVARMPMGRATALIAAAPSE